MKKYQKRPEIVEAIQYTGELVPAKKFLGIKDANYDVDSRDLILPSPNEDQIASIGDWILKDEMGSYFVLDNEEFVLNYIEVKE